MTVIRAHLAQKTWRERLAEVARNKWARKVAMTLVGIGLAHWGCSVFPPGACRDLCVAAASWLVSG